MKTFFSLLWTKFVVTLKDFFEWLRVVYLYYPKNSFWRVDLSLLSKYFFKSPFQISKRFLKKRGEKELYAYGETPLTTMALIARNCQITSEDKVIELGSGRGRGCFWLNTFVGCGVKGIDYIPQFIEKANSVKDRFHLPDLEFECGDFLETSMEDFTVVYLYGTSLDEATIQTLIEKFETLPSGTKIITVSYPLSDYTKKPQFRRIRSFPVSFNWGKTEVFLQTIQKLTASA